MNIRRWASKALFQLAGAVAPAPAPVAYTPVVKLTPKTAYSYKLQEHEDLVTRDIAMICMAEGRSYRTLQFEDMSALIFGAFRQREFAEDYQPLQTHKRVLPYDPDLYAWFMPASSGDLVVLLDAVLKRLKTA